MKRMPQSIGMVCGPITTGGAGSIEKNLERFAVAIDKLTEKGKHIFSQMPFEEKMEEIKKTPYYKQGNHLLETFYLPIFASELVHTLYFLPGWKSSYGATWEHEQAQGLDLEIKYLSIEWLQ